ncbi:NUDIX domain-containing protein [Ponticaulis sp.]|uniref:NUDIX domain-containing protein n=1 Tax=Ponticaulis sp. TaxID=2020902 RepID=UPI0025D93B62|nr:NUDIX domain-containing protein [Ponticaulis sp.]|tara:strand:+ start:4982 stop:5380 length:399 start_codon:yes stop_codon:yes gene_type:complete
MTLGVRGLVINAEGQCLLIRHTYTPGWHLPGGGVEKKEYAELSLERELVEEAGIVIEGTPILCGVFSNHSNFPNDHVLLYRIEYWSQTVATSKGEIAEAGFFSPESLPSETTPATRRRIDEWQLGKKPSIFW